MAHAHDIRDQIDRLESLDGEGTELVTVTVPPGKAVRTVRERIASEHASAENIRSDRTRERVRRALDRIRRELSGYAETPDNGLVVYAGVVDDELVAAVFDDLPRPVAGSTYRCDDHFHTGPLEAAVAPGETFGLVVVERGGAAVGRLVGERVVPVRIFDSRVMGSFRAGGQSAQRFARERERQKHEFFREVGETANGSLVGNAGTASGGDDETVAGLAVGGTLATAKEFVAGGYLDHRLTERLLGTYAVDYANERGLHQLVERADAALLDAEQRAGRERLAEFFRRLRDDEPVAYGPESVERAMEFGAVDSILLSSALSTERRNELETTVSNQGGETFVVPAETDDGARFTDAFGGVGALLRFPIE